MASLNLDRENWHPSWHTWRCPSNLQPHWCKETSMAWNTFCWLHSELHAHIKNVLFIRLLLVTSQYTNGSLCLKFDFKWHGSHILMKMRKTCFAIRNKDLTFSNSTTCYIPIIHPTLWQFTKVPNYGLLHSKGILQKCLPAFSSGFFQITILIWETLFWIMNLCKCSNASFCVYVFWKNK